MLTRAYYARSWLAVFTCHVCNILFRRIVYMFFIRIPSNRMFHPVTVLNISCFFTLLFISFKEAQGRNPWFESAEFAASGLRWQPAVWYPRRSHWGLGGLPLDLSVYAAGCRKNRRQNAPILRLKIMSKTRLGASLDRLGV